jgi:hypothetical protein
LPVKLTRRDFLKFAGAGTAGVATLGASATLGSRYEEYLPRGGSKVNVILVIVNSLGTIKKKCLKEVPENAPQLYYSPYLLCKQSLEGDKQQLSLGWESVRRPSRPCKGPGGPRTKIRT